MMVQFLLVMLGLFHSVPNETPQELDLSQYRWENRIIVLIAEDVQNPILRKQVQALKNLPAGLKERDLVLFVISKTESTGPKGKLEGIDFTAVYQQFKCKDAPFHFRLIGKDGGTKLKRTLFVEPEEIFAIIDAMPMRRAEIRQQKQD
ncbi:MAG: DUF4174 domain-containing protein [Bacteroidota bacterium]